MSTAAASPVATIRFALGTASRFVGRGWTQGAYCRGETGVASPMDSPRPYRVDLAWALARAAAISGLPPELLLEAVRAELAEPYRSDEMYGLERWNDHPLRSKTQVLFLLARVAELYR